MFKVGLTGGIGSGKSTVARILGILGVPVFAADDAGKQLLQEDMQAQAAVKRAFGEAMYVNGQLDRKGLAALVFNDPEKLKTLNGIVHPLVREAFAKWTATQSGPYVVMEAAILRETGGDKAMDHLVWVWANARTRVARVMQRDHVAEADVLARIQHQGVDHSLPAIADTVIMNDGIALVIPQVLAMHEILLEKAKKHGQA